MQGIIIAFLAFSGGLIAVVLGKILNIYRQDKENLRRVEFPFRKLELLIEGNLPLHLRDKDLKEISEDIERIYI